MLPRIITRIAGWVIAVFYDVTRSGPRTPPGPVLVVANHPNALVDPVIIFRTAGRATRPLAKAPLFEQAVLGTMLKGLGGLPVYRRQDDPARMHLNDQTFDAAIEALRRGGAVQIYPEGHSHSEPSLTPLRTGAARIALWAEQRGDWRLGLKIQPVGLTYTRKHLFRGGALAVYGEPFEVAPFRARFEEDDREAVREVTDLIQERLERLTLNFDHPEDRELVDVAERLYASQKRLAHPRERRPMVDRLPTLQRFADGLRWVREADPARHARLQAGVRRYLRLLTLFGASEGDVPTRYPLGAVLRYSARQLAMLLAVLPLALAGAVAWYVPFVLTRYVAPRFRPELDQLATYKLGTAILAFPLWYFAVTAGLLVGMGTRVALVGAVGLPLAGLAAIAWRDRQATVREDVRVYIRARRRSQSRDRLAEQRTWLVEELDAVGREWRRSREEAGARAETRSPAGTGTSDHGELDLPGGVAPTG
jgi:1-acyl-sn-glycerol-3-phosphate acyltransferase